MYQAIWECILIKRQLPQICNNVYIRNGNAPEALAQAKKAVETLDKVKSLHHMFI